MAAQILQSQWGFFNLTNATDATVFSYDEFQTMMMSAFDLGVIFGVVLYWLFSNLLSCCRYGHCCGGSCLFGVSRNQSINQGGSMHITRDQDTSILQGNGGYVVIDGQRYYGRSVEMREGRIYVDGVCQDAESSVRYTPTQVHVHGPTPVGSIKTTSANVRVEGDSGSIQVSSGNIVVNGNCTGYCKITSGNIKIGGDYMAEEPPTTISGDVTIRGSRTRRRRATSQSH